MAYPGSASDLERSRRRFCLPEPSPRYCRGRMTEMDSSWCEALNRVGECRSRVVVLRPSEDRGRLTCRKWCDPSSSEFGVPLTSASVRRACIQLCSQVHCTPARVSMASLATCREKLSTSFHFKQMLAFTVCKTSLLQHHFRKEKTALRHEANAPKHHLLTLESLFEILHRLSFRVASNFEITIQQGFRSVRLE